MPPPAGLVASGIPHEITLDCHSEQCNAPRAYLLAKLSQSDQPSTIPMDPVQTLEAAFSSFAGAGPDQVEPIAAHASPRTLVRFWRGDASFFASLEADLAEARAFVYLSRLFKSHGLRVPQIYLFDDKIPCIIMEDLGHYTLYDVLCQKRANREDRLPPSVFSLYQKSLVALIDFQFRVGRLVDFHQCYPTSIFDEQSMVSDYRCFIRFVVEPLGIGEDQSELEVELSRLVGRLLDGAPWETFIMRDFQSRNIVIQDDMPGFIDYQRGRCGPMQYDVASLLYQARAQLHPLDRSDLLAVYLDAAASEIPNFDRASFLETYEGFALLRLLQATGRAGQLGTLEGNPLFVSSVPQGVQQLNDLLSSANLPVKLPKLKQTVHFLAKGIG